MKPELILRKTTHIIRAARVPVSSIFTDYILCRPALVSGRLVSEITCVWLNDPGFYLRNRLGMSQ
jgi:hypothetical protein